MVDIPVSDDSTFSKIPFEEPHGEELIGETTF